MRRDSRWARRLARRALACAAAALAAAACSPPPGPPLGLALPTPAPDSGLPHPASEWWGAAGTCTVAAPDRLFGLLPGERRLLSVRVLEDEVPLRVEVRRVDGAGEAVQQQVVALQSAGDDTRLVISGGQGRVLAWSGIDRRFHFPGQACEETPAGAGVGSPSDPTTAAPPATPAAPSPEPAAARPAAAPRERFAGGRTAAWWQERLTSLRRDGPPDLYQLALRRARAAGLTVVEGAGTAVTATLPEAQ